MMFVYLSNCKGLCAVLILKITALIIVFRFCCRLNALEFRELKDKLQATVRNARNIVVIQSLSEQFLQAFAEQINHNPVFHLPEGMVSLLLYTFNTFLLKTKNIKTYALYQEEINTTLAAQPQKTFRYNFKLKKLFFITL